MPPGNRFTADTLLRPRRTLSTAKKRVATQGGYTAQNHVELVHGGKCYFDKLQVLINEARSSIFIRIYIWQDDKTGQRVAKALQEAASRGVAIFVWVDGYASQGMRRLGAELEEAGIHFRYFEPLLRSRRFYFGRRLHEKVVVVDGRKALVGGLNFADRYNEIDSIPAWLDFAICVEGAAAAEVHAYCSAQWFGTALPLLHPAPPPPPPHASVRVRFNDWVKRRQQVWETYFNWIHESRESITIIGSYFLPGRVLLKQLKKASERGVKVRLILAAQSDVAITKQAERYLYRNLLGSGIEIYEYLPTVLHAKMMVVDGRRVTIGSYNVNNVSTYASLELNLDVRNRLFAHTVEREMETIIRAHCLPVKEPNSRHGFFSRMLQRGAYELIRVVLHLSTFYFRQE